MFQNPKNERTWCCMTTRKILFLVIVFLMLPWMAGCGSGFGPDALFVCEGQAFDSEQGKGYVLRDGPVYDFRSTNPHAEVRFVEMDRKYYLPPGRTYVMLEDPACRERRLREEHERATSSGGDDSLLGLAVLQSQQASKDAMRQSRETDRQLIRSMQNTVNSQRQGVDMVGAAVDEYTRQRAGQK
jgi:hypothetical protein